VWFPLKKKNNSETPQGKWLLENERKTAKSLNLGLRALGKTQGGFEMLKEGEELTTS